MGGLRAQRGIGAAYALSGACALVYQVVWNHAFTERFGASGTTFLVVLCAFIGGLGLGAISSRRAYAAFERRFGGRGLRNYGRTELAIAATSVVFFALTKVRIGVRAGGYRPVAAEGLTLFTPTLFAQGLELLLAILAVGVPCFLMGLTFPYLCSLFPEDARLPSRPYAANTFGASVAVLATEFVGFVALGYLGCFAVAVAGTLAIGLRFARVAEGPAETPDVADVGAAGAVTPAPVAAPLDLTPALLGGFLCGGLQALCYVFVKLLVGPSAPRSRSSRSSPSSASGSPRRSCTACVGRRSSRWPGGSASRGASPRGSAEPDVSGAVVRWAAWSGRSPRPSPPRPRPAPRHGRPRLVPYALWSLFLPWLCDRQQERARTCPGRTAGTRWLPRRRPRLRVGPAVRESVLRGPRLRALRGGGPRGAVPDPAGRGRAASCGSPQPRSRPASSRAAVLDMRPSAAGRRRDTTEAPGGARRSISSGCATARIERAR